MWAKLAVSFQYVFDSQIRYGEAKCRRVFISFCFCCKSRLINELQCKWRKRSTTTTTYLVSFKLLTEGTNNVLCYKTSHLDISIKFMNYSEFSYLTFLVGFRLMRLDFISDGKCLYNFAWNTSTSVPQRNNTVFIIGANFHEWHLYISVNTFRINVTSSLNVLSHMLY